MDRAVEWEKRSGATFESTKTTLVHFTRATHRSSNTPIMVKGIGVAPTSKAKILGVIMNSRLQYKKHIARTATKGLCVALALKRLRMLSPLTA